MVVAFTSHIIFHFVTLVHWSHVLHNVLTGILRLLLSILFCLQHCVAMQPCMLASMHRTMLVNAVTGIC